MPIYQSQMYTYLSSCFCGTTSDGGGGISKSSGGGGSGRSSSRSVTIRLSVILMGVGGGGSSGLPRCCRWVWLWGGEWWLENLAWLLLFWFTSEAILVFNARNCRLSTGGFWLDGDDVVEVGDVRVLWYVVTVVACTWLAGDEKSCGLVFTVVTVVEYADCDPRLKECDADTVVDMEGGVASWTSEWDVFWEWLWWIVGRELT